MSKNSSDIWVCDRCGAREECERNKQPVGWAYAHMVVRPLMACVEATGGDAARKHLCDHCKVALRRFFEPLPQAATVTE